MRFLDEATLVAYVDGELDPATAREVEKALAGDARAQALLDELISTGGLVRSAFAAQLAEPVPERLVQAVLQAPGPASASPGGGTPWWARPISALAASVLMIAVGFGGGFLVFGAGTADPMGPSARALVARAIEGQQLLDGALENKLSGTSVDWQDAATGQSATVTPVKTYRRKEGGFCREYRIDRHTSDGREIERGIACRTDDGRWVPRYVEIERTGPSI